VNYSRRLARLTDFADVAAPLKIKFFGYESSLIEDTAVNVADVEKTTVDCTDHLELCGGSRELVQAIVVAEDRDYSWATVVEYLQRPDNGAATKRISTSLTSSASTSPPARSSSRRSRAGVRSSTQCDPNREATTVSIISESTSTGRDSIRWDPVPGRSER